MRTGVCGSSGGDGGGVCVSMCVREGGMGGRMEGGRYEVFYKIEIQLSIHVELNRR